MSKTIRRKKKKKKSRRSTSGGSESTRRMKKYSPTEIALAILGAALLVLAVGIAITALLG